MTSARTLKFFAHGETCRPHPFYDGWAWARSTDEGWTRSGGCERTHCVHGSAGEALACHRKWEAIHTMKWIQARSSARCELSTCGKMTQSTVFVGEEVPVAMRLCPDHGHPAVKALWLTKIARGDV